MRNKIVMTDQERVSKLFNEDRALYDESVELANKLGLGGIWKGIDKTILTIAEFLKAREYNQPCSK